jgi:hypothetical protein
MSISDGDTVTFEINDVATWQLTEDSRSEDLNHLDASKLYPLSGPVCVGERQDGRFRLVGDRPWSWTVGGIQETVSLQMDSEEQEVRKLRRRDQDTDPTFLRSPGGRSS